MFLTFIEVCAGRIALEGLRSNGAIIGITIPKPNKSTKTVMNKGKILLFFRTKLKQPLSTRINKPKPKCYKNISKKKN